MIFIKWKTSIIFVTFAQIWSLGGGKGKGFLDALILSRLHILSYASIGSGVLIFSTLLSDTNQFTRMRNTCDGDSDLYYKYKKIILLSQYWKCNSNAQRTIQYLYNGCHASIWPPPLTINWCPRDHFLNLDCFLFCTGDLRSGSHLFLAVLMMNFAESELHIRSSYGFVFFCILWLNMFCFSKQFLSWKKFF